MLRNVQKKNKQIIYRRLLWLRVKRRPQMSIISGVQNGEQTINPFGIKVIYSDGCIIAI